MGTDLHDEDVVKLIRSAEQLARLARDIGEKKKAPQISRPPPSRCGDDVVTNGAPGRTDDRLIEAACAGLDSYRARPGFGVSLLLRDRAWPLILELFIAGRRGTAVPVKAACLILGGPQTTAVRCVLDLERAGIVRSMSDDRDARRRLLMLTRNADESTQAYLAGRARPTLKMALRLSTPSLEAVLNEDRHPDGSCADQTGSGVERLLQSTQFQGTSG